MQNVITDNNTAKLNRYATSMSEMVIFDGLERLNKDVFTIDDLARVTVSFADEYSLEMLETAMMNLCDHSEVPFHYFYDDEIEQITFLPIADEQPGTQDCDIHLSDNSDSSVSYYCDESGNTMHVMIEDMVSADKKVVHLNGFIEAAILQLLSNHFLGTFDAKKVAHGLNMTVDNVSIDLINSRLLHLQATKQLKAKVVRNAESSELVFSQTPCSCCDGPIEVFEPFAGMPCGCEDHAA